MHLRRGMFRVWIVISLAWALLIVGVAYQATSIPSLTRPCSVLLDFKADSTGQNLTAADVQACETVWRQERLSIVENAVVPPLALLCAGLVVAWIGAGFRRRPRPS